MTPLQRTVKVRPFRTESHPIFVAGQEGRERFNGLGREVRARVCGVSVWGFGSEQDVLDPFLFLFFRELVVEEERLRGSGGRRGGRPSVPLDLRPLPSPSSSLRSPIEKSRPLRALLLFVTPPRRRVDAPSRASSLGPTRESPAPWSCAGLGACAGSSPAGEGSRPA